MKNSKEEHLSIAKCAVMLKRRVSDKYLLNAEVMKWNKNHLLCQTVCGLDLLYVFPVACCLLKDPLRSEVTLMSR